MLDQFSKISDQINKILKYFSAKHLKNLQLEVEIMQINQRHNIFYSIDFKMVFFIESFNFLKAALRTMAAAV